LAERETGHVTAKIVKGKGQPCSLSPPGNKKLNMRGKLAPFEDVISSQVPPVGLVTTYVVTWGLIHQSLAFKEFL
jgi:hypothetical protein